MTRPMRSTPYLLVAAFLVAQVAVAPPVTAAVTESPDLFGMASEWASHDSDLSAFRAEVGTAPAFYQMFFSIQDGWPDVNLPGNLDRLEQLGVVPFVEIVTANTSSAFDSFLSGGSDSQLRSMVSQVASWVKAKSGRRILVSPFPEANLSQFVWSDPDDFLRAYRKVVDAFQDAGLGPDRVRYVWWLNGVITGDIWRSYYPGDGEVDIIGFSKLNRNAPYRDYDDTFGVYIDTIQNEVSRTKPILVAQTGSVEEGTNRDAWLRDMFRNLDAEDQVIGAVYFNYNKFEGGKDNDYRVLVNGQLEQVVIDELDRWSPPSDVAWIFDGRMDAWEVARLDALSGGFIDTLSSTFVSDIKWLAESGITQGCNPPANDRFCPDDRVTRGQMAAFLRRGLEGTIPTGSPISFSDTSGSVFAGDIAWLSSTGVTKGCTSTRFCPGDYVTREQMAAFLHRALVGRIPAGSPISFSDTSGSIFAKEIAWLSSTGITTGCTSSRFCPRDLVTRGQMAAFLHRALG